VRAIAKRIGTAKYAFWIKLERAGDLERSNEAAASAAQAGTAA
jgi:hypothetical protein